MKPIDGESVLSIIHGPATTGHIRELSQFLRCRIDVRAEDRLMLIGKSRGSGGQQPASLRLSHTGRHGGGHFALFDGREPSNPDAGCHPQDCAFDAISDQTGYPASLLRQVVAQRMLIKLYRSRLRGRDHRFQCSSCSISGGNLDDDSPDECPDDGTLTRTMAKELVKFSKWCGGKIHATVYRDYEDCNCHLGRRDLQSIDCIRSLNRVFQLWKTQRYVPVFKCDNDVYDLLCAALNSEEGRNASFCVLNKYRPKNKCDPWEYGYHEFEHNVCALKKEALYYYTLEGQTRPFRITRVVLRMRTSMLDANEAYYVEEMIPLHH